MSYHLSPTCKPLYLWLILYSLVAVTACSPVKKSIKNLHQNPVFKDSFTGFVLFDPENKQILLEHLGSKYFTPASNTKLFTFYVANRVLGDSVPAFEYEMVGDSIWLWGTGDPSFLNPDLPASQVYDFLYDKHVFLVPNPYQEPVYGPGWAWDDFSGSYQREKGDFPIYGNAVHISWDSIAQQVVIDPPILRDSVALDQEETNRKINGNQFSISKDWDKKDTLNIPLFTSTDLYTRLWSDTLKTQVSWVEYREQANAKTLYSIPTDSVFKRLLQVSDNFLAEQLILMCSWKLFKELNSSRTIEKLTDSLLNDLPQAPVWVDGSGLSRYNLFTPFSIVRLLDKIYAEVGLTRIFDLFPAGGESGTIEDYYQAEAPYIYAKTGTLRNNHALSGYLIGKSGKLLIFSFMHNHFTSASHPVKKEMEKLLWQIHLKY